MGKRKFEGMEQVLRERYEAGATLAELRRDMGLARSDWALKKAIERAGGQIRAVVRYATHSARAVRQRNNEKARRWRAGNREERNARAREIRATEKEARAHVPGERTELRDVEKECALALFAEGRNFVEIGSALGRTPGTIARFLRSHMEIGPRPVRSGAGAINWRGGRVVDKNGYVLVWVAVDDIMAAMRDRRGYISEHRLVMARSLGRPLATSETVHHVNGDRADNRIENLQLRHGKHGKGAAMVCLDCGSHNVGFAPITED